MCISYILLYIKGFDATKCAASMTVKGLRKGTTTILAKYEGRVLKRYNITVTSDWTEYLEYVSWRKGVEAQIWNNSMSVTQKLDAAEHYIKTNFEYTYEEGASIITAYKTKKVDCLGASELFGHMAQDLNLRVGYVRASTGEIYDYIGEAIGGHVYNAVMLNGKWEFYDAQPPH